ncbi:MAG: hypothetical protein RMZ42_32995 [Nostoc sp. DedQUE05]|uniref:hypothetical protein n=1 Tax=Nostoc sp. DedQUE05 TaxID=3075391 RepID=UPI002AD43989|nr:hypothetical protein [Nostoc sp. DedQUE05]MDZ8096719.1 hypothetical protein [Nostoc sp. DedQUE05]
MAVSQQISPSALRAYKLSKYANGQPGKMLLEAKRARRVTSQFMSKSGAKEAAKKMKALKSTAANAKKVADATKKASDIATKVNEVLLKNIPGSAVLDKASRVGGILGILAAIGTVALLKFQEGINDGIFDSFDRFSNDLTKVNTTAVQNGLKLKTLDTKIQKFEKELNANAKDYYQLNKQTETIAKNAVDAKKQSNDALYETREGRKILTGLAEAARKLGNDALYEARANKREIDSKITSIQQQISKISIDTNQKFQQQVQATIQNIQKGLVEAKAQAKVATDTVNVQAKAIGTVQTAIKTVDTKIVDLKNSVVQIINNKTQPLEIKQQESDQKTKVVLTTIEGTVAGLKQTYQLSYEAQAAKWNADLMKLQGKVGDIETVTSSSSYKSATADLTKDVNQLKQDVPKLKSDIETNKADINKIDTRLKDQEKVNSAALPKLDQILGILPLIPARAAAEIRPSIPTIPQIETAAATGTCRTTQPGGCMNRALNDNATGIVNNNNTNAANILDAVNTGANAALLAGQETILQRLGDQLPGGIGGKLSRFAEWMHLDRVLNIMILAATIHNALMLSNDIGQTLLGAINNVLQLIGLKKEDGSSFDLGSVISGTIENLIKSAIGDDNYTNLKEAWAKANRIYQATTNVINSFLNLSQTILQASELIAAHTGKIGNALKKGGVILENAYGWMNPQPKFNRVTQFLEGLQNGASTIQMVTQAPLDVVNAVTETTTAATEFVKAVKEDDKPENKATPTPEPDELKAKEQVSKANSQPNPFDFFDLFDGED